MPTPEDVAQGTRPDGTSLRPGPKTHPRITATNLGAFEGCWKRFMLRRSLPPGTLRTQPHLYFSPLSFSYAWSREHSLEIRAFGTTEAGNSLCVRITQFPPYFFARLPDSLKEKPVEEVNAMLRDYSWHLNQHLRNNMPEWERKRINMAERVIHVDATHVEEHFATPNYAGKEGSLFARIYGVHPQVIRSARIAAEFPYGADDTKTKDGKGRTGFLPESFIARGVPPEGFAPYEADVDFIVRFLTDKGLSPSAWWRIDALRATEICGNARASTCNAELLVTPDMLSSEIPDAVSTTVAPYVKCKYDIEVETSGRFPKPAESRVIQIALRITIGNVDPQSTADMVRGPMADGEYVRRNKSINIALCLGSVRQRTNLDFIPISFKTEEELLWAFNELVAVLDIDDMAGHFTDGFDNWFLLKRAEALDMKGFKFLGRVPGETAYSNVDVESERRAAFAKRKSKKGPNERREQYMTKIPGVCMWDFLYYAVSFVRDATSYSLNALAAQFLEDKQKLDVEYALIAKMQTTEEGRSRLAEYCDRDVLLTQLLDKEVGASEFMRELADLSFVPRQSLLNRKSVFRVTARWLYEAQRYDPHGRRYLMQTKPMRKPVYQPTISAAKAGKVQTLITGKRIRATAAQRKQAKYSGGTVLEPCTGYYKDLIAVFDFMSLYPSIMRWRNICYVTILPPGRQDELMALYGLTEDDVWHAPLYELSEDGKTTVARISKETMPSFVKNKVMEGILPYIQRTFAILRSQKKRLMGAAYKECNTLDEAFKTLNAITPDGILNREQRTKLLVLAAIYNNQQNCIKIFMNSLYGVMGAVEATFPLRDGARTVTSEARQAIEVARYNAETMFPSFMVDVDGDWRKLYEFYDPQHSHERVQEFVRTFNERKPVEGLPFKPEVIYGDSVPGDCPVVVRHPSLNELYVVPIGMLCPNDNFKPWGKDKEHGMCASALEVLVDGGFTPIRAIVRHRTDAKLMETRTESGVVLTTPDHALVNRNLVAITPSEVKPGALLATASVNLVMNNAATPRETQRKRTIRLRRAWFQGFLFAHARQERGTVNEQEVTVLVMRFAMVRATAMDVARMAREEYPEAFVSLVSIPNNTARPDHVLTISPRAHDDGTVMDVLGDVFSGAFEYQFDEQKFRKVPQEILNAVHDEQWQFLAGVRFCDSKDEWQQHVKRHTVAVTGGVGAQAMLLLMRRFYSHVRVHRYWNALRWAEEYELTICDGNEPPVRGRVVYAQDATHVTPHCPYVYDLVTDKQRYCAGVGDTVVHNTDSIFVRYRFFVTDDPDMTDVERVTRVEKYNDYIAAELTKAYCTDTMCLQFEKICTRAYLITKKKYMLRMLLREGGKYALKIKESGTCGVRRDGCELQRLMCERVRHALMEDSSPEEAIESVRKILAYVMAGSATLDEVMMTSTISMPIANYKDPGPPHVELARKEMRAGARPYNKGDRVHYIVVGGLKTDAIRDRVRTPQEAIENDIPYCKDYYGMSVIVKQARILLGPLVDTRTYEEKRAFQDWARVVGFQPDGEARIREAKKKFKEQMHRTVDKLIMHGLSLEESRILEQSSIGGLFGEEPGEDEPDYLFEDEDEAEEDGVPDDEEILDDAPSTAEDDASCAGPCRTESNPTASSTSPDAGYTLLAPGDAFATPNAPPKKRAREEEATPGEPAAKRRKGDEAEPEQKPKPFFTGCFKYSAGGGVSAAFKSTASIKNTGKQRVVKTVPKSSPLFKSIVVYDRCIRCNVTVPESRGYLCGPCEIADPNLRRDEYNKQRVKTNALEKEHHGRWNACHECRGRNIPMSDKSQCDITHCVNYVCPNWGRRQTVTRDLQKAHTRLAKLGMEVDGGRWSQ